MAYYQQDYSSNRSYSSPLPPPIPPNPYRSAADYNSTASTASPTPPPGAYNPQQQQYDNHGTIYDGSPDGNYTNGSAGDSNWRESSFISMYGGGGTGDPQSPVSPGRSLVGIPTSPPRGVIPYQSQQPIEYPNGIGNGNTYSSSSSDPYRQGPSTSFSSPSPLPPQPPPEPVTFVSSSGATFTRNPSMTANTTPAYPSYATPRSNYRNGSYEKRPLNPPPIPNEYYQQQQQPALVQSARYDTNSYDSGGGGSNPRLSNESSSERYSVYSYPGSIDSVSTASTTQVGTRNDGIPNRKQSLEHLKALSLRERDHQISPSSYASEFPEPIPETEPYPPPVASHPEPRSRQPTILMSPPIDSASYSSPSPTPSSPYASYESPHPYPRNNLPIDSNWSNGGRRTSSYGSNSSFSHGTTNPTYASTIQTSPAPSPSLSHSYSFTSENSQQNHRRPSQATLSPHSSTSNYRTTQDSSFSPYPFSLSPSPSTNSEFYLQPSSSFNSTTTGNYPRDAALLEEDSRSFVNPAFLSHLAVWLKDQVPRGNRTKNSGVEHWGFTGKEIVDTILKALPPPPSSTEDSNSSSLSLPPAPPPGAAAASAIVPSPTATTSSSSASLSPLPSSSKLHSTVPDPRRKLALSIARTLQQSLWFHEVDFDDHVLKDLGGEEDGGSNQVYTFLFLEGGSTSSRPGGGVNAYGSTSERDGDSAAGGAGGAGGEEIPTGVITSLTRCESLVCTKENAEGGIVVDPVDGSVSGVKGACYSFDCPNRKRSGLHRVGSTLSSHSGLIEAPLEEAENWASSVPKTILESLDKQEIAYQNQVFELIHGEQKYYDDLTLIETGFVEPLKTSNPPIIQPHRLPHFLQSILLNISDIRQHSSTFLGALRAKQSESLVVRGGIGKIVLMSAVEWGKSYIQYTTGFPMADWLFKEEKENNPRFNELLMDFHKRPEASKRGFDTFHNRATFRGLRYILLLEQILKNAPNETDQDRQDREYLEEAIKVIKQQGKEADLGVGEMKGKVMLRELERTLIRKQGDLHDLELLDESRQFFMSSRVYRRPEGSGFTDQFQEAHLILLDNYLITTKAPRPDRDGKQKYQISRRPVPLDLIQLKASSFSESPVPRSSGFHLRSNRSAGSPQPSAPSAYAPPDSSLLYPISFFQMGRFDGLVYVYVDTAAQRLEWEKKLKEAVSLRVQRQEANRVVRLDPLADATFGTTSTIGSLNVGPAHGTNQFGKPTCSTPLQTIDGLWLIIAGCQEGIFIGWRGRPQSMQQVVHLAGITQCAVLPDFSFLLVVANKVLVAYALEALIPTKTANKLDQANKAPQRLSGQKDVSFFRVGKVGDTDPRTLVIYAKKSGVKESVFKALEPVSQNDRAKGGSSGHRFLGFGTGRPEWFRVHKEFFMPSLVTSLQFQRSKLALIGSRGVEIMDLESMRTMTVPDFPSVRHNRNFAALAKRCEEVPTLGMFRIGDSKFLLVYADFAFHVGRHGEPIEGPFIEWESKPEQVAFCFPYIFAISPTIIEIRNAFSGRLAQFITGSHIHLTFDGSAISSSQGPAPIPSRGSSLSSTSIAQSSIEAETPVEKRLHVSMRTGAYHVLYEIVIVA
ncbi:uncharacterized protein JCM6883_005114 [Sporobolomyces salmoneus]|uniref:uncharacterized protein n=1 Tax=Sporobolomyces salmoneus TaxID=183962 RepID=UPI0031784FDC